MWESVRSFYLSGSPGFLDNDIREATSGGGLWLGKRRVSGATIHRKGCHGGELRLVSRQFLWCVVSSGRLALLDLSLLPWLLLAMTKHATQACVDKRTKERDKCAAGAGLKDSMGLWEWGSPPPRTGVFINGGTLHLVNETSGQGPRGQPGGFSPSATLAG